MKIEPRDNWALIKRFLGKSFRSTLHFSVATVHDGILHVTPIGSILLGDEGKGSFFEIYTHSMGKVGDKIEILGVNSSKWFWISSLIRGRFLNPPGIRLTCVLGDRRSALPHEVSRWRRRIVLFKHTPGYRKLWGSLQVCREFTVVGAATLDLGKMTSQSHL